MNHPVDNSAFVLTAATVRTALYTLAAFAFATLIAYQKSSNWGDALVTGGIACLGTLIPTGLAGAYDVSRAAKNDVQIGDVGAFTTP